MPLSAAHTLAGWTGVSGRGVGVGSALGGGTFSAASLTAASIRGLTDSRDWALSVV